MLHFRIQQPITNRYQNEAERRAAPEPHFYRFVFDLGLILAPQNGPKTHQNPCKNEPTHGSFFECLLGRFFIWVVSLMVLLKAQH